MSKLDNIRALQVNARKTGDKSVASVLTLVLSESMSIGKRQKRDPTDAEVITVIKNMAKKVDELLAMAPENDFATQEKSILMSLLPTQLTEEGMKSIVIDLIAEKGYEGRKYMGVIMQFFKDEHHGTYDGKALSDIVKESLNE